MIVAILLYLFPHIAASNGSDVYSFGVIIWECLSRAIPFEGRDLSYIYTFIVKKQQRLRIPGRSEGNPMPDEFNKV